MTSQVMTGHAMPIPCGDANRREHMIARIRKGRMSILVNGAGRASLFVAANRVTSETVNFMAKHARGLVCLALTETRANELGILRQPRSVDNGRQPDFGVSIEARSGVTTGISAYDRARTIAVAVHPGSSSASLVTPGHVFPVIAAAGGVFERLADCEAAVDLARLAGLAPLGVFCEILGKEGGLAEEADYRELARTYDLDVIACRDIADWRAETDPALRFVAEETFDSSAGSGWRLVRFQAIDGREFLALRFGSAGSGLPMTVAWHDVALLDELIGRATEGSPTLHQIMREAGQAGPTVIAFASPNNRRPDRSGPKKTGCAAPLEDAAFVVQQILAELKRSDAAPGSSSALLLQTA